MSSAGQPAQHRGLKMALKAAAVLGHNYPGSEWYADSYNQLIADGQVKYLGALKQVLTGPDGAVRGLEEALKPYYTL